MKQDLSKLSASVIKFINAARRHIAIIYILFLSCLFGLLIVRVGMLARAEPTPTEVTEKLQTIKRPKIDPVLANKIKNLEQTNVEIQALFKFTRDNPFQD